MEIHGNVSLIPTYFVSLPIYDFKFMIMKYHYPTSGTCSRAIDIEITDGIITSVAFTGGCHGNTQGISALVKGQRPEYVIERLKGIRCGAKPTSCPDQLATALRQIVAQKAE